LPRSRSAGAEPKLIEFHIMRLTASPAKLVGIVRAVGLEVGVFPVAGMQGSLNLRGYWEFAAQNRAAKEQAREAMIARRR
jgi:hypothetical protein